MGFRRWSLVHVGLPATPSYLLGPRDACAVVGVRVQSIVGVHEKDGFAMQQLGLFLFLRSCCT